jgi:predicted transcriptional regulator
MAKHSSFTEEIVYSFVCENPGLCTYEISKKLEMSGGRVRYALKKLEQNGLVKFKFRKENPRIKKLTYPVDVWSLIPKELKPHLLKLMKKHD